MRAGGPLLEREDELSRAEELLSRARDGEGAVLVIEGAAGAGKTRLLREISGRARDTGFSVLAGRGAELERGFAFGLLRQVLEPALALLDGREQARLLSGASAPARPVLAATPDGERERSSDPFAALNGLFWLVAGLAERSSLLLALDDVQWADEPSLRFLSFALGRVESVPVLILLTRRPAAGEPGDALVGAVAAGATTVRLPALGGDSVRTLVAERLGREPSDRFAEACLATSGGNPFLLVELLRALSGEGVSPTEANVGRVVGVSPENVARSVSARLERVGEPGARFARALAAVGDDSPLGLVAQVGGLAVDDASSAADALAAAGLIARDPPLRFEHPLLRTAVEATFTPGERLRVHGRAAALLETAGAPAERIALHLLETEPAGNEPRAQILADAGRAALGRGAPETAARLLERAVEEPPAPANRSEVLFGLGIAEREQGIASAVDRLREAAELTDDPLLAARAVRELGWAAGPRPEAQRDLIPLYERAAEAVRALDGQLALALEGRRLGALLLNPGGSPSFEDEVERFRDLPGATSEECALLCFLARNVMLSGGSAAEVAEIAGRAVRNLDFTELGAHSVWLVGTVLWLPARTGLHEVVDRALNDAIELAARSGSANVFAWTSVMRGIMRHVAGDLRAAEADAHAALDSGGAAGPFPDQPLVPLIESLADQGKITEAEAVLAERGLSDDMPAARPYTVLLIARGRLRAAAGDMAAARADLDDALARLGAAGSGGITGLDARLETALVAHALGDEPTARRFSDETLAAARAWQGERALGGALRVAGLLRRGAEGIALLEEAVETLAVSPARLWEARAHVDLGAALRRANRRRDSRPPLRRGIELAERCGATPLAELGRRELAASGGRVPPREVRGVAVLTPSELRVAEHAAAGLSNPEIAQRLFVTIKTVEMHLSNTYRKLDIRSRHELQGALEATASK